MVRRRLSNSEGTPTRRARGAARTPYGESHHVRELHHRTQRVGRRPRISGGFAGSRRLQSPPAAAEYHRTVLPEHASVRVSLPADTPAAKPPTIVLVRDVR